jgi:hypothetical protein
MYWLATASGFATPSSGSTRNGSAPVSVTGTASVNHQHATSTATAAVRQPATLSPSGGLRNSMTKNSEVPSQKPVRCTSASARIRERRARAGTACFSTR